MLFSSLYFNFSIVRSFELSRYITFPFVKMINPWFNSIPSPKSSGFDPAVAAGSNQTYVVQQQQVDDLEAMGFSRERVISALHNAKGDINHAVQQLLSNN